MLRITKNHSVTIPNSLALIAAAALVWSLAISDDSRSISDMQCGQLQLDSSGQSDPRGSEPGITEPCDSTDSGQLSLAKQMDLEKRAIDASRKLLFLSAKSVLNRS